MVLHRGVRHARLPRGLMKRMRPDWSIRHLVARRSAGSNDGTRRGRLEMAKAIRDKDDSEQGEGGSPKQGRKPRTHVEPRQMVALRLLMEGRPRKAVAAHLGVDGKTIGRWLQEPAVKRELGQQLASVSAETWIQMVAQEAEVWATFRELLQSSDERIRLRASTWYLGRILSIISVERLLEDDLRALTPLPKSLSTLLEGVRDGEGGVA
jgi:hypothetical protein